MKHLKITLNNKSYDVTVEVLNDIPSAPRPMNSPVAAPVVASAPVVAPAPVAAPAPAAPVAAGAGTVVSPMSGLVLRIPVKVGDTVTAGQEVIVLEAMKMETPVAASASGTVKAIYVAQGDAANEGQALIEIA